MPQASPSPVRSPANSLANVRINFFISCLCKQCQRPRKQLGVSRGASLYTVSSRQPAHLHKKITEAYICTRAASADGRISERRVALRQFRLLLRLRILWESVITHFLLIYFFSEAFLRDGMSDESSLMQLFFIHYYPEGWEHVVSSGSPMRKDFSDLCRSPPTEIV